MTMGWKTTYFHFIRILFKIFGGGMFFVSCLICLIAIGQLLIRGSTDYPLSSVLPLLFMAIVGYLLMTKIDWHRKHEK